MASKADTNSWNNKKTPLSSIMQAASTLSDNKDGGSEDQGWSTATGPSSHRSTLQQQQQHDQRRSRNNLNNNNNNNNNSRGNHNNSGSSSVDNRRVSNNGSGGFTARGGSARGRGRGNRSSLSDNNRGRGVTFENTTSVGRNVIHGHNNNLPRGSGSINNFSNDTNNDFGTNDGSVNKNISLLPHRRNSKTSRQVSTGEISVGSVNTETSSKKDNKKANVKKASAKPLEDIFLLNRTGTGDNDDQRKVVRRSWADFMSCRLQYLQPPATDWNPHPQCAWPDENAKNTTIQNEMDQWWSYKPLDVNDKTRWKSRVMEPDDNGNNNNSSSSALSMEERLGKATAILNKLSWTTLDKLTVQFVNALQGGVPNSEMNKEIVHSSMSLVVNKAMEEPHFAELYAHLSGNLALNVHKSFKKELLHICQEQFEQAGVETKLPDDPSERELALIRDHKRSIGLMQFIGELYKETLIKGAIMITCIHRLCDPNDEERLECFAKLMTTIGERLHEHEEEPEMHEVWNMVYSMADKSENKSGPKAPSVRIKFLLQDLIELKENGWVKRREDEKAKTIAEIHKEVAEEQARKNLPSMPLKSVARSQSGSILHRNNLQNLNDGGYASIGKPNKQDLRRAQSDAQVSSLQRAMNQVSVRPKPKLSSPIKAGSVSSDISPLAAVPIVEYANPHDCGEKAKSILKEYFVGGDTTDAITSIDEVVGAGNEGDIERGTSVIDASISLVLERKEEEVRKMLSVLTPCLKKTKIPKASLVPGILAILEFLRDIEIDAPMAGSYLSLIVAEWINADLLRLDFLLDAPEPFLTEGRPADFAAQVLRKKSSVVSDSDILVIDKLLKYQENDDKKSAREWLDVVLK